MTHTAYGAHTVDTMAQGNGVEELIQTIAHQYEALPRQLKAIAHFITQNRQQMVVVRILDVASACNVQPSAVVRFAQRFGFSGFSELQAVFRDAYASGTVAAGYQQRIQAAISEHPGKMGSVDLASAFMKSCQEGLATLSHELDAVAFERAVGLLQEAGQIYIVGVRRMYSVASYLAYAFSHTRKRIILVDGAGGMFREQVEGIGKGDVLVAISMAPYGSETRLATELACERGASVVAISDSPLSPIARGAAAVLTVHESEAFFFRTMPSTVCLAQALFIAVAYRLEQDPSSKARQFAAD